MLTLYPALNTHEDYLRMLARLQKQTREVEYALVDPKDTALMERFAADVLWKKQTKKWWGTWGPLTTLYRLRATPQLFRALRQYETFFRYYVSDPAMGRPDLWEPTDFGVNDIAFFDAEHREPLLHTTTHEGILVISDALRG